MKSVLTSGFLDTMAGINQGTIGAPDCVVAWLDRRPQWLTEGHLDQDNTPYTVLALHWLKKSIITFKHLLLPIAGTMAQFALVYL